jgi:hypothetical protein
MSQMKRRSICIVSLVVTSIVVGYLFFAGWLLGFVITKYMAGKTSGKQGRIKSIIIPLGKYRVHLHHWLICSGVVIFVLITEVRFLASPISYGILGGLVFQGIYCYSDWHKILITARHQIEKTALRSAEHLLRRG